MEGRYRGDREHIARTEAELYGRYRGDGGEMEGRYRGDREHIARTEAELDLLQP